MASLYKYFTKQEHMNDFIAGNVRFSSLAYYKHLEDRGTIADKYEGEALFSPRKEDTVITYTPNDPSIEPIIIKPEDLARDPEFNVLQRDYSHYFVFCSSHTDVFKTFTGENSEYKYYVEFDRDDFNKRFDDFCSFQKNVIKEQHNKIGVHRNKIGEFDYAIFNQWDNQLYDEVKYYDYKAPFIVHRSLVMSKTLDFQQQQEYRHCIYLDYLRINEAEDWKEQVNKYQIQRKHNNIETDITDVEFIKCINIIIPLGNLKILSQGKI